MTKKTDDAAIKFRVNGAAFLIYLAYRLLGATKDHAWDRARVDIGNAVLDKTVEKIGIVDPRRDKENGIQAFFEGGPIDRETRFVEECGMVTVTQKLAERGDTRQHVYRRTSRMRVQQVIFEYKGLMVPPPLASMLDKK